jgi:triphosphatase
MAHEIELKLDAPTKAAARLPKARWLQKFVSAPVQRSKIASVYFDTRSAKLHDAGISLRVRHMGDKAIQTVKRDPKTRAFERQEWECEIEGNRPNLDLAKDTALTQFNLNKLRRKLRPVFETDVRRVAIPLSHNGNNLELAIDDGVVRAGRRTERISEVEIEIKNGELVGVLPLVRRIAAEATATYGAKTKAERGYALSTDGRPQPVFADKIALRPEMVAGQAFQAIGFSCLHHFVANQDSVIRGDAEGVHQMRVGLRRFRAAISFFKELVAQPDTKAIKRELRWLTDQLGPARDLDVLLKDGVKSLEQEEPQLREVAALENDVEDDRRIAFAQAKAAVESQRCRKLLLECAIWLAAGTWFTSADPLVAARRSTPIPDFAAGELSRRTAKIIKKSKKLDRLDTSKRHKLRIAIKKVRYGCGFFANVYLGGNSKRRRKTLTVALKGIQSALGKLNDAQVHDRLAHRFTHTGSGGAKQTQKAFAIGLLTGREHAQAASLLADARKAARKVSHTKPFWH